MRDKLQEQQLRMAIREILISEGIFDDILSGLKTGAGKVYDTVSSAFGVKPPQSGFMKTLDDFAPDEELSSKAATAIRSRGRSGLKALVAGDSQAGGSLGDELRRALTDLGFGVSVSSETGASGDQIARSVEQAVSDYDLVVVLWGGNDSSPDSAARAFDMIYSKTYESGVFFIAIGPPPATVITDMSAAQQVFGSRVETPTYHLEREGGTYPQKREMIADAIEEAAADKPLAIGYGIASHFKPGDNYPDQPDGIHCRVGAEEIVDEILESIGIANIVDQIRDAKSQSQESPDVEMLPLAGDMSGMAGRIADAYPKMAGYADEIVRVAAALGTKAEWLANVINFESRGGDPQAVNPRSGATGLIQFMPKTAQNLGTSTDALYNMDAREQMQYVEEYFAPYRGNLNSQEDVYMAVFYPKAMGNPDFEFSDRVIAQNPGIRTPRDYVAKANSRARLA